MESIYGVVTVGKDDTGRIIVSFHYEPQLVEKVKTIDGRKWHPTEKYCSFPNSDGTLEKILKVLSDSSPPRRIRWGG